MKSRRLSLKRSKASAPTVPTRAGLKKIAIPHLSNVTTLRKILISEGDPSGINYEIIESSRKQLLKFAKTNQIILVKSQNQINTPLFKEITEVDLLNANEPGLFQLVLPIATRQKISIGKPGIFSAECAYHSLIEAVKIQKKIGADLITLPLSKEWLIRSGIKNFTGHTETLAKLYNKKTFMLMSGKKLNVITLTTHVPLKKVASSLKKLDVEALANSIKNHFSGACKIGILGFNPHAGEGGKIGNEEFTIIQPIIKLLKKHGFDVSQPLAADSAFVGNNLQKFDLFLSCYHDQGLIPFKMIEDKNGINITLGLNFTRVSPDHGPAYDIAGKGIANPDSFIQCLNLLCRDYRHPWPSRPRTSVFFGKNNGTD